MSALFNTRRAPLLVRPWLYLQSLWVRWEISSTEDYLVLCASEGIFDTVTLRYWHDYLGQLRCELAALQAQMRG
jgi:hypothetical protein